MERRATEARNTSRRMGVRSNVVDVRKYPYVVRSLNPPPKTVTIPRGTVLFHQCSDRPILEGRKVQTNQGRSGELWLSDEVGSGMYSMQFPVCVKYRTVRNLTLLRMTSLEDEVMKLVGPNARSRMQAIIRGSILRSDVSFGMYFFRGRNAVKDQRMIRAVKPLLQQKYHGLYWHEPEVTEGGLIQEIVLFNDSQVEVVTAGPRMHLMRNTFVRAYNSPNQQSGRMHDTRSQFDLNRMMGKIARTKIQEALSNYESDPTTATSTALQKVANKWERLSTNFALLNKVHLALAKRHP